MHTHGHLNKLTRLKTQVSTAGKKIVALDQEWTKFKDATVAQIRKHAQLYQQCRADLLESFFRRSTQSAAWSIPTQSKWMDVNQRRKKLTRRCRCSLRCMIHVILMSSNRWQQIFHAGFFDVR